MSSFKKIIDTINNCTSRSQLNSSKNIAEAFDLMSLFFDEMEKILGVSGGSGRTKEDILFDLNKVKELCINLSKKDNENKNVFRAISTFMQVVSAYISNRT